MGIAKILLADEDDEFLEILQTFLSNRGYECKVTDSGVECAALLRGFEPTVLVLNSDLRWGGADGVLARMHEEHGFDHISVISTGMSGLESPVSPGDRPTQRPVVAHLEKPYALRQLLAAIHSAETQHSTIRN